MCGVNIEEDASWPTFNPDFIFLEARTEAPADLLRIQPICDFRNISVDILEVTVFVDQGKIIHFPFEAPGNALTLPSLVSPTLFSTRRNPSRSAAHQHTWLTSKWKSTDRGLDVFQQHAMNDAFNLANRIQEQRAVQQFEVTYLKV